MNEYLKKKFFLVDHKKIRKSNPKIIIIAIK